MDSGDRRLDWFLEDLTQRMARVRHFNNLNIIAPEDMWALLIDCIRDSEHKLSLNEAPDGI